MRLIKIAQLYRWPYIAIWIFSVSYRFFLNKANDLPLSLINKKRESEIRAEKGTNPLVDHRGTAVRTRGHIRYTHNRIEDYSTWLRLLCRRRLPRRPHRSVTMVLKSAYANRWLLEQSGQLRLWWWASKKRWARPAPKKIFTIGPHIAGHCTLFKWRTQKT
jgi:hypothetical protein